MTVTSVEKDPAALTMTLHAAFDAPITSVWQLWADPRRLERWWGPPSHPATFVEHDLRDGGRVTYFMTGPDGEQYHGWWEVLDVEEPRRIEVRDGFGHPDAPADMPVTTMRVTLDEAGGGTRMTIVSTFASAEAMEQLVAMGMEEGIVAAMGQMDDILAEAPAGS